MPCHTRKPGLVPATPDNIRLAKKFLLARWIERAQERGRTTLPVDLENGCKFASLFGQTVFGGTLEGNWRHQYNRLPDGCILDLTDGAGDTGNHLYHDPLFWGNHEHRESLKSNLPRVNSWVEAFLAQEEIKASLPTASTETSQGES